ncbi:hypothetical protein KIV56_08875 [Cryobacterium breve]|uniref:Uncharacterized protein n=1 Tax=Cryobacterium breve TaxID=1259258 RepID=A0ABY7NI69_9MICO|nr:hypothetical protein [Cryobacterium breve]WBM81269.1 hypothetical protein KIV56_08875 [Cryobacterium breve]
MNENGCSDGSMKSAASRMLARISPASTLSCSSTSAIADADSALGAPSGVSSGVSFPALSGAVRGDRSGVPSIMVTDY